MAVKPPLRSPSWHRALRVPARTAGRLVAAPWIFLRVYAVLAGAAGVFLTYALLDPRAVPAAARMFGTSGPATGTLAVLAFSLALCARAFASADAVTRGRGLQALAGAHLLLAGAMLIPSRSAALAPAVIWPLLAIGAFFAYSGPPPRLPESAQDSLLTLFGRSPGGAPRPVPPAGRGSLTMRSRGQVFREIEGLRSEYERHIREAARQEERHRLARDLHDAVKQQIFVVQTAAATAQARFDSDPAGARAALEDIRESARGAMSELEAMLDQLQATALEPTGLIAALQKQCEALGFRTGAEVTFTVGAVPPADVMPPGAAQAILRIVQEALANVGRHARARHVRVGLDWMGDRVSVTVTDDGAGFSPGGAPLGMGMANMGARAAEIGGSMEVVSTPGAGTTIRVDVPVSSADARADAHWRWALLYGGMMLLLVVVHAPRAWRGEPIELWDSMFGLVLVLLFAAHLGASRRLRRAPPPP